MGRSPRASHENQLGFVGRPFGGSRLSKAASPAQVAPHRIKWVIVYFRRSGQIRSLQHYEDTNDPFGSLYNAVVSTAYPSLYLS
jgi:hypothetical protein